MSPDSVLVECRLKSPGGGLDLLRRVALAFSAGERWLDAAIALERAARLDPEDAGISRAAARCWQHCGRYLQAAIAWLRVTELDAADGYAWLALGVAIGTLEKPPPSFPSPESCFDRAGVLLPDRQEPLLARGRFLASKQLAGRAVHAYLEADRRGRLDRSARNELGNELLRLGEIRRAVAQFDQALEAKPDDPLLNSNRLVALINSCELDAATLAERHREWGRNAARRIGPARPPSRPRGPGDKIRVGYLVNLSIGPLRPLFFHLLSNHDRSRFEIFVFAHEATVRRRDREVDAVIEHLRQIPSADGAVWADAIRHEQIDIVVDRCGHFGGCPVDVHVRGAAPVSVVLPGYPCTLGLPAGWRITDPWADPPGATEHLHDETLLRLDRPFACYQPPTEAPEVGPLPADRNGFVTFGLFHQRPKLNHKSAVIWARILRQVDGSRLLIHNVYGSQSAGPEELDDPFIQTLLENGVSMDRIRLVGRLPLLDHVARGGRCIDRCLLYSGPHLSHGGHRGRKLRGPARRC